MKILSLRNIKKVNTKTSRLFGINPLSVRRLLLTLAVVFLIALLGYSLFRLSSNVTNKNSVDKIQKLREMNDCKSGLQAISGESGDQGNVDYSIAMLSYRAECQAQLGQYKTSLDTLKEVKWYYEKTKNYDELYNNREESKEIEKTIKYEQNKPTQSNSNKETVDYKDQRGKQ